MTKEAAESPGRDTEPVGGATSFDHEGIDRAASNREALSTMVSSPEALAQTALLHPSPEQTLELTQLRQSAAPERGLGFEVEGRKRYRHIRMIAHGATASVTEAYDERMHRRVAIKRIHPELVETDGVVQFHREALLACWLEHPNILPIYDMIVGESGAPELVMKLVDGRTLAEVIDGGGSDLASIYQLTTIMTKVCDAVQFAHEAGVVHGDLKPQNILIGRAGEVLVTDWGLSTLPRELSSRFSKRLAEMGLPSNADAAGGIRGTPAYMAPEQAVGSPIDARTDVFGLGVILYQILTGVPLYEGMYVPHVVDCASRAEFVPPRVRAPEREIRPDLERLCCKALSLDPGARQQSALELAQSLGKAITDGCWFGLRSYRAGETIVREGEPSEEAFLIESGRCQVLQESAEGTKVLREMGPGEAFGEAGIFTGKARSATVVALGPVQVQCVDRESLKWAMSRQGPLAVLSRALANRFLERERELS